MNVLRASAVFLSLGFALLAFAAQAADTHTILDGWLNAQKDLKTWKADFTQTRTLKTLKQPLVSTGHVSFAAPERFRWELGNPAQTIAVRNETQMAVIYPRLKRAERYPLTGPDAGFMGQALALLDAGFPRDRATFESRFQLESVTATNGAWQLDLQPANPVARRMLPLIQVTLATNDFSLLANEIVLPDGSRMRNEFTNAVLNAPLDDSLFKPELGGDYTITEPLKQ